MTMMMMMQMMIVLDTEISAADGGDDAETATGDSWAMQWGVETACFDQ